MNALYIPLVPPLSLPEIQPGLRGLPLLDAAISFAKDHPECHDQGTYGELMDVRGDVYPEIRDGIEDARNGAIGPVCGTSACIAGWMCVIGGAEITYNSTGAMLADYEDPASVAAEWLGVARFPDPGTSGSFQRASWAVIDGGYREGYVPGIFHDTISMDTIEWLRDEIAAGRY